MTRGHLFECIGATLSYAILHAVRPMPVVPFPATEMCVARLRDILETLKIAVFFVFLRNRLSGGFCEHDYEQVFRMNIYSSGPLVKNSF
jgi:hypothetical protein